MAKKVWDEPIDKTIPWDGSIATGNAPVRGSRVEEFIKNTFEDKIGVLHYDAMNNRYLAFADQANLEKYLLDPTQTNLVLGTFDAPFNYSAEIKLETPTYNAVFLGSTGNYISFTFDIKNKQGASTGENVNVTYTFIRNASKKVVTESRRYGEVVRFDVDDYIEEGTNTIIVGVTGQSSLASTTVSLTYNVVHLSLTDQMDISKVYDLSTGAKTMEVFFSVSGYGTKTVEWFLDGVMLDFVKSEDEVVDVSSERTKYITLSNLSSGIHTLQFRAFTLVNGEKFYTDSLYREIIVNNGDVADNHIAVATSLPHTHGIVADNKPLMFYGAEQYIPYDIRFTTRKTTNVTISLQNDVLATVVSRANEDTIHTITSSTSGALALKFSFDGNERIITMNVESTSISIEEITTSLLFDFNARGRSNNDINKESWAYKNYVGSFSGFNWNASSGWVGNSLFINSGATFSVNIAPLLTDATSVGKTLEFEFSTRNVENDDAVVCNLLDSNGVGLIITASEARLVSAAGVVVSTRFKSGETNRIAFVVNRNDGVTYKGLAFIYVNGILSGAVNYGGSDNFISESELSFVGTDEAQVELRYMRFYDTALSMENILNNYILYRDSLDEMLAVYYRNDIFEDGTVTFSPDKAQHRLPVMIITGDIPTLEAATSTSTQIIVDISYVNEQYPDKSFTMKDAALRIQGTSSLAYPRKNFRFYTTKVASTEVYDHEGRAIENKLYSFKDGAQPVDCWCLKADYAESSGTHNTGIARLWNDAMYNAQIQYRNVLGEEVNGYVLRTNAQKAAVEAKYPYDVRTTIDGFPILLFYKKKASDTNLIFLGKYNFNNDKSTPSVFGFEGIPNFDNSKVQCWETKDNGNALGLFTDISGFDANWSEAYESRYPDTKTPNTSYLKAFSLWVNSVSKSAFEREKWAHLDVYKVAAYYVYLMRFGAVDQVVKNGFLTSEDGVHFFYINYDNDTINGLINTGELRLGPDINRQTIGADGEYVYAGHSSVLWNHLEEDAEFMDIVKVVDNALYSARLRYDEVINVFNEEQASKWVERVYNQDAEYKYLLPFVNASVDNLFMLQGSRSSHRSWWLSKRFSLYDSLFVSGNYRDRNISFKCLNDTKPNQRFSIVAGTAMNYGYGVNNGTREVGVALDKGESHEFITTDTLNLGDVVKIFAAANIQSLDLSHIESRLAVLDCSASYDPALGTKLKVLKLGGNGQENTELSAISGLGLLTSLQELNIEGYKGITTLDLTSQNDFRKLYATGSSLASVSFVKGAPVDRLELPSSLLALELQQLPYLTTQNLVLSDISNIYSIVIRECPNIANNYNFVKSWYESKITPNSRCSLVMDNIDWIGVDGDMIISFGEFNTISLSGRIALNSITNAQKNRIKEIYGRDSFTEGNDLVFTAPDAIFINGNDRVDEGFSTQLSYDLVSENFGKIQWSVVSGAGASINNQGVLTTVEIGQDRTVAVKVEHTATDGVVVSATKNINVSKAIRPSNADIIGADNIYEPSVYTLEISPSNINREYSVVWSLSGSGASNGYVSIAESNKTQCSVNVSSDAVGEFTITATITADNGDKITSSKTVGLGTSLKVNIASNQGVDATIGGVQASVSYGSVMLYAKNGDIVSVPVNHTIYVIFPKVEGYTQPEMVQYLSATSQKQVSVTYSTTVVTVKMADNQTSLNDIANATATVASANITIKTVKTGESVKVPIGDECIVTWNALSGYATPSAQTFTASGVSTTKTGTYNTTLVYVTMDDNQPSLNDITNAKATVKYDSTSTKVASGSYVKVPTGKSTTITWGIVTGYRTPDKQTFTATGESTEYVGVYKTTVLTLAINTNQSSHSDVANATVLAKSTTVNVTLTNGGSVKIPFGETITLTASSVEGYASPTAVEYTAADVSKDVTMTYNTTLVTVVMADNQTKYNDIANATATVEASGITTTTVKTNSVVKVPTGVSCKITWNDLSGYKTPSAQTFTTSGTSVTKTGTYQTEVVTVTVTSDIALPAGYTITVSDIGSQTTATATYKVPFGVSYTVSASEVDGYTTPSTQTFTANSVSRNITVKYLEKKALFIATYNTELTSYYYTLINPDQLSNVISMEIDGVSVEPVASYKFDKVGEHIVKYAVKSSEYLFYTAYDALVDMTVSDGVTEIGEYAFAGCGNLLNITIPNSVIDIGASAFQSCRKLASITIPEGVKEIKEKTFYDCGSITSINIPDSVTSIGVYAFGASGIVNIVIPDSVTSIGASAFYSCDGLKSITIPGGVTIIEAQTFSSCDYLESVTLPNGVTKIGDESFYGCRNLKNISIPNSVTQIGTSAFEGCVGLKGDIIIPDGVTKIANRTFRECHNIESVTIPNSVTTIGSYALYACRKISRIYCYALVAPTATNTTFTSVGTSSYTNNILYVPSGATGYDASYWLDPLCNPSKNAFTLSATL